MEKTVKELVLVLKDETEKRIGDVYGIMFGLPYDTDFSEVVDVEAAEKASEVLHIYTEHGVILQPLHVIKSIKLRLCWRKVKWKDSRDALLK